MQAPESQEYTHSISWPDITKCYLNRRAVSANFLSYHCNFGRWWQTDRTESPAQGHNASDTYISNRDKNRSPITYFHIFSSHQSSKKIWHVFDGIINGDVGHISRQPRINCQRCHQSVNQLFHLCPVTSGQSVFLSKWQSSISEITNSTTITEK